MSNISYSRKSEPGYVTHIFEWEIKNFIDALEKCNVSAYRMQNSKLYSYPQLKMELLCKDKGVIEIYYMFPTSEVLLKLFLKVGLTEFLSSTECININANKWQYLTTMPKSTLLICKNQYFKLNLGNYSKDIVLHIEFKIHTNLILEKSNELKNNLKNVLNSGYCSDVIMKSNEGKEYKVHKVILACSPVLKAHFDHDTTECHTNVVEAPFESEVVEEVLSYIYSEKVTRIEEIPGKILGAADYYELNGLKSLCGSIMRKQLSVENVFKTLELAMLYRVESLKQSALEFIANGNAGLITQTEYWDNHISVDLLKSIYEYIFSKLDENIVYCEVKNNS